MIHVIGRMRNIASLEPWYTSAKAITWTNESETKKAYKAYLISREPNKYLARILGNSITALSTEQAYLQEASPSLARCQPVTLQFVAEASGSKAGLTSIDIFMDKLRLGALDRISSRLSLELTADVSRATLVKGSLECVTLPSKEVVPVLGVSSSVSTPKGNFSAI